jgi:hypothetical protein
MELISAAIFSACGSISGQLLLPDFERLAADAQFGGHGHGRLAAGRATDTPRCV